MLDGVRATKQRSDTRALIALWLVVVVAVALAIWARSIILGVSLCWPSRSRPGGRS